MALFLVTPPTAEPLTIAEAKAHLRLGSSAGEPAPAAPTAALASPAAAGNVDNGAHRYGLTVVTADGESELGLISDVVTVADKTVNGKVTVSNIARGGAAVTARKLYRTAAGGSTYLFLATLNDNTTSTYTDNIADASLGAQAPATNSTADPELTSWITAARQEIENFLDRKLLAQTWDLKREGFPAGWWTLPFPPVSSITSVTYVDTAGATQTWNSAKYQTDLPTGPWASPARLAPAEGEVWPTVNAFRFSTVTVRFVCGYGAAASAVPAPIVAAMKLLIGHWYEHREAVTPGTLQELPLGVKQLLWPFKAFVEAA